MMKILAVTVEKYNACEQTEGHIFRHLKWTRDIHILQITARRMEQIFTEINTL
jgi:hypothetical protein